ncbi:hypothetical protein [Stieleria marina]|uniref:Uncharacterized protein n=1 Tax=Stieleria marina TaxID=1930275 RepID=A0A517NU48_9BACT|nr:hypothetical protein K239x_25890 [Planctomycetes bacterium K23_9]
MNSDSTSERSSSEHGATLGAPGERFLLRVRSSAVNVLGESQTGRQVLDLCDEHAEARDMILQDRSPGATVVAVVGATGQGKSWLIRQMVRDSTVASSIQSGNNAAEATEKLHWVGPVPPVDLDSRYEQYLHCEASKMQSIGVRYLLVDSPGATDDRRAISAVASRALSLASVLLLVVRRDQLRSQAVGMLAKASEGTVVIPVVNAVRERDASLDSDIDGFIAHMRQVAPTSAIVAPVILDDFDVGERSEESIGSMAARTVAERLQDELGNSWEGDRRRSTRLAALDGRFRAALHNVLSDRLPGLTIAVRRLHDEATKLPAEVAETLVGSGGPLRAAVRSRLRLSLLTDTPAICFPYRSQLGLLNLTHGAWDRVLLSLSGSLPSLVSAVWSSTKNLANTAGAEDDVRDGLRRRSAAAVADRLGPLATRFRDELAQLRHQGVKNNLPTSDDSRSQVAYLAGIDALQEESQRIFDSEVDREAMAPSVVLICALLGTGIFWFLMSGPVIALYSQYFGASFKAFRELGGELESFPRPEFSMIFTSLLVSILPTALFAMLVLSFSQRRGCVLNAEKRIRDQHHESIIRLQQNGVLRLRWDDPLLTDAEFLVSAGTADAGDGA